MAKKQQDAPASQRREEMRQQRQQRLDAGQNTPTKSRSKRARKRASSQGPWFLIGGIVLMVIVVIGIFLFLSQQQSANKTANDAAVFKAITTVDPKVLASVGSGSAQSLLHPVAVGTPLLKGPTGKPQILYMGANYCPYCAAQRWAIIVSLSRFGTFGPLQQATSSEYSIPTYTFHQSTYTSKYIDFVPVEMQDNNGQALDAPTVEQQHLLELFDAPPYTSAQSKGSIPFLLIGNKLTSTGSYFSPLDLINMTHQDIATQLKDPNSNIARDILGAANYLTAAVCTATNNQPANVCTADPIPQIQKSLPKAMGNPSSSQLGLLVAPQDMIVRRQEWLSA